MALIKCRECGQMISDKATRCPKCGCPTKIEVVQHQEDATTNDAHVYYEEEHSSNKWMYAIIAVLAVALAGLGYWFWQSGMFGGSQEKDIETQKVDSVAVANPKGTSISGLHQLKGSIGKYGVEMMITVDGDKATGLLHYNSQKKGVNLSLKGNIEDAKMIINEYAPSGENTGRFEGIFDGETFKGNFQNLYKDKVYSFMLSKVSSLISISTTQNNDVQVENTNIPHGNPVYYGDYVEEDAMEEESDYDHEKGVIGTKNSSDEQEMLTWLEGNWRYQMTSMGEVLEMRVGISGETIVVILIGRHHYNGRYTIEGNHLVYNRHNGISEHLVIDRNNQRLMADENNPMERF